MGTGVGGVREQIPWQKMVVTMTLVYSTLRNQFNTFRSLVNHHSEALQDKWIFSVAAG